MKVWILLGLYLIGWSEPIRAEGKAEQVFPQLRLLTSKLESNITWTSALDSILAQSLSSQQGLVSAPQTPMLKTRKEIQVPSRDIQKILPGTFEDQQQLVREWVGIYGTQELKGITQLDRSQEKLGTYLIGSSVVFGIQPSQLQMQEGIEEGQTGQASTLPMAQGAKASSMDNTTLFFSLLGTANTIHDFPGLVRQPIQALQAYQSGTLPSKMVMFKKTTKWAVGATLAVYTLSQTPKIAAWIQEEYFKDSKKGEP